MATEKVKVLFLSYGCPWPPNYGGAIRTFNLLKQILKLAEIDIIIASKTKNTKEQNENIKKIATSIDYLIIPSMSINLIYRILIKMLIDKIPYHCALIRIATENNHKICNKIDNYNGIIFTNVGSWGTLAKENGKCKWVLNQCDADIDLWLTYAAQNNNLIVKIIAYVNWWLCSKHFPIIYNNVDCIVCVCDEDKNITEQITSKPVYVIENGVDCQYFTPNHIKNSNRKKILFTGTSARRNLTALKIFTNHIFPKILKDIPDAILVVAGNFTIKAQKKYRKYRNIFFTGKVDDIRPFYNDSDVFVAPFKDAHGSKLKIVEAITMEKPVISTPLGLRGFNKKSQEYAFVAKNNDEFANLTVKLLNDEKKRYTMGKKGRVCALEMYDWDILGKKLIFIFNKLI